MKLPRYLPNSLQGRYDLITPGRKEHTQSLNLVIDIDISLILFYMEEMYLYVYYLYGGNAKAKKLLEQT